MTKRTGVSGFSERVSLNFKAAGRDTRSDELILDLIEFLSLKKGLGILPHWVKHAVVEQYLRETRGLEPNSFAELRGVQSEHSLPASIAPKPSDHQAPVFAPTDDADTVGRAQNGEGAVVEAGRRGGVVELSPEDLPAERPTTRKPIPKGIMNLMG